MDLRNRLLLPIFYSASRINLSDLFLMLPLMGFLMYYPSIGNVIPIIPTLLWPIVLSLPMVVLFFIIFYFIYDKRFIIQADKFSLSIVIYLIYTLISGALMNVPGADVKWYREWWYMISGVLFMFLILMSFDIKMYRKLLYVLYVVAVVNCLYFIADKFIGLGDDTLFADINILGRFLIILNNALLIKQLSSKKYPPLKRAGIIALLLLFFLTITISLSRSSYLQYIITTGLIILITNNKKLIAGSVVAGAILVVLFGFMTLVRIKKDNMDVKNASDLGRISALYSGYNMFKSSPLIGVGYSSHRNRFDEYQNKAQVGLAGLDTIHNFYVAILAETGVVGLAIYLYFNVYLMFVLFKRYRKQKLNFNTGFHELFSIMALFTYQFNGLFFPLPNSEGYYWMFVAYALATYRGVFNIESSDNTNNLLPEIINGEAEC